MKLVIRNGQLGNGCDSIVSTRLPAVLDLPRLPLFWREAGGPSPLIVESDPPQVFVVAAEVFPARRIDANFAQAKPLTSKVFGHRGGLRIGEHAIDLLA